MILYVDRDEVIELIDAMRDRLDRVAWEAKDPDIATSTIECNIRIESLKTRIIKLDFVSVVIAKKG